MRKSAIAATYFFCIYAIAGPFGLMQGMSLDTLKKQGTFVQEPSEPYFYTSKSLTNGHPDFESYTVILTPQDGLCKIGANGKNISTSVYGSELVSEFKNVTSALTSKYGTPENIFDFLRSGSIWKDNKYWMISLLKKERVLLTSWTSKNELPDSLKAISVTTIALDASTGFLQLSYEFKNTSSCLKIVKEKQNSNL